MAASISVTVTQGAVRWIPLLRWPEVLPNDVSIPTFFVDTIWMLDANRKITVSPSAEKATIFVVLFRCVLSPSAGRYRVTMKATIVTTAKKMKMTNMGTYLSSDGNGRL